MAGPLGSSAKGVSLVDGVWKPPAAREHAAKLAADGDPEIRRRVLGGPLARLAELSARDLDIWVVNAFQDEAKATEIASSLGLAPALLNWTIARREGRNNPILSHATERVRLELAQKLNSAAARLAEEETTLFPCTDLLGLAFRAAAGLLDLDAALAYRNPAIAASLGRLIGVAPSEINPAVARQQGIAPPPLEQAILAVRRALPSAMFAALAAGEIAARGRGADLQESLIVLPARAWRPGNFRLSGHEVLFKSGERVHEVIIYPAGALAPAPGDTVGIGKRHRARKPPAKAGDAAKRGRPRDPAYEAVSPAGMEWLRENGVPVRGDGGLAKFRCFIEDQLRRRKREVSETTCRRYAKHCIAAFEQEQARKGQ